MEDILIIKYIKRKNEKGLELLLQKYGGLIRSIVRKHLKDILYYEDECIDDILISIWENINSFKTIGSFQGWIAVISKFKAIDYKRKYLKLNNFVDIDKVIVSDEKNFVDDLIYKELKEEIQSLLSNLKDKDKEIFIKYYIEGKSTEHIVKELGIPKAQIYNKLSRGRKKLFTILKSNN